MLGIPELECPVSDSHSYTEFNADAAKDKGITSPNRIQGHPVQKHQPMIVVPRPSLFGPVNNPYKSLLHFVKDRRAPNLLKDSGCRRVLNNDKVIPSDFSNLKRIPLIDKTISPDRNPVLFTTRRPRRFYNSQST
jgi:hypothetical protein